MVNGDSRTHWKVRVSLRVTSPSLLKALAPKGGLRVRVRVKVRVRASRLLDGARVLYHLDLRVKARLSVSVKTRVDLGPG